jgi:Protein of unknown function (DUF4232)
MLGGVSFTNTGKKPCRLPGYIEIELVGLGNHELPVRVRRGQPGGAVFPSGAAATAVVLPAGKPSSASEMLQWSNWCGAVPNRLALELVLPGHERIEATPVRQPWGVPRCNDSAAASVLLEGPVQRS